MVEKIFGITWKTMANHSCDKRLFYYICTDSDTRSVKSWKNIRKNKTVIPEKI